MRHYNPAPFAPEKRTLVPLTSSKDAKHNQALKDMLVGKSSYESESNGSGEAKCTYSTGPKVSTSK